MPPPQDFLGFLRDEGISCIAEVKRRSPSKGELSSDLQPEVVAKEYVAAGAACLSVLTDQEYFGGSPDDLKSGPPVLEASPVLRKDFTVQEADVIDARLMGADAVLLIVAALGDEELLRFHRRSGVAWPGRLGGSARRGRTRACARPCSARLIGVNRRDLRTFEVDQDRARALAAHIPADLVAVAESGIRDSEDSRRLAEAGFDAILVGETLVRSKPVDRPGALHSLIGLTVVPR